MKQCKVQYRPHYCHWGWGWVDELVRGETLCKEKQVFYVPETATVTETTFLKIIDNIKLDTHTHTHTHTV